MNATAVSPRPRAGRPTREQALARHHELLDEALRQFLEKGFEMATIDAIAGAVGMTKRTVYARYSDKVSLFRAAVNLAFDRYAVEPEVIAATETGDLEQTLRNIARLRVNQVLTPNGTRLQRIIQTESYRFPDLTIQAYEKGAGPTIQFLKNVLQRATRNGQLAIADAERAAAVFMSMVVSGPVRAIVSGNTLPDKEIDARIAFATDLFLKGALPR